MPLSPKQALFVQHYLVSLNATEAAVLAGYSKKSARQMGCNLLANPAVKKAVAAGRAKIGAKLEVTAENVVAELAKIGFANMADYMKVDGDGYPHLDFGALNRDQSAALAQVEVEEVVSATGEFDEDDKPVYAPVKKVKFKLADKRAALVDLGRHLGIFVDKTEVKHSVDESISGLLERIAANGRRIQDRD